MTVEVRLYATLAEHVDGAEAAEPFGQELPEGSTIVDLIDRLGLPEAEVHLVIVDGRLVHDPATLLSDKSRVALFPPVGGG